MWDQYLSAVETRLCKCSFSCPLRKLLTKTLRFLNAATPEPRISRFYSKENPTLRLSTGFCEGDDSLAAQTIDTLQ